MRRQGFPRAHPRARAKSSQSSGAESCKARFPLEPGCFRCSPRRYPQSDKVLVSIAEAAPFECRLLSVHADMRDSNTGWTFVGVGPGEQEFVLIAHDPWISGARRLGNG